MDRKSYLGAFLVGCSSIGLFVIALYWIASVVRGTPYDALLVAAFGLLCIGLYGIGENFLKS